MKSDLLKIFQSRYSFEKNVLISPFCFDIIVNLIAQGTTGATQAELLKFIEASNPDLSYNKLIATLEKIKSLEPISQFEQTNTFYFEDTIVTPQDSFTQKIRENLSLEFAPIPEEHKGIFQFIIESALNVKAKWKQRFEEVPHKTEFFTLANGEEIETLFITQDNTSFHNETKYLQKDNFQAIQIPMEDEQLVVEIYLPEQKDGLSDLVQNLTVEQLLNWKNEFEEVANMEVVLPKFNKEIKYDLTEDFEAIGFKEIFEWSWDFNPMFKALGQSKIMKITQENFFKLNEIGIEAGSKTRFYGGTGGIPRAQQHILFEAQHPFLYLIRELKSNTVLFIGTFDAPDLNQDFSLIKKNQKEIVNFSKDSNNLSLRLGFLFASNAIERIVEKHKCENIFTNWYIKTVRKLIRTPIGLEFDRIFEMLNIWKWNNSSQNNFGLPDNLKLAFEESEKKLPNGIKVIFNLVADIESYHQNPSFDFFNFSHRLIQMSNMVLDDEYLPIPEYKYFEQYIKSKDNLWGDTIDYKTIKFYHSQIKKKITTTLKQKKKLKQVSLLRRLKPSIWNISIRGAIYLQMIFLDKIYKEKIESPIVKDMLHDIKIILSSEDIKTLKRFKKLTFLCDQTGFFEPSFYLKTKEESMTFSENFPSISTIVDMSNYIIRDYDNSLQEDMNNYNSFYNSSVFALEKMVEENIPLPDQTFFEKYTVKDGNRFGDPIPVDLKIFEEL